MDDITIEQARYENRFLKEPGDELAKLRQELVDLRVQYDQLCIECREFFNQETTAVQAQQRLYQIRDHIRRYEQRRQDSQGG